MRQRLLRPGKGVLIRQVLKHHSVHAYNSDFSLCVHLPAPHFQAAFFMSSLRLSRDCAWTCPSFLKQHRVEEFLFSSIVKHKAKFSLLKSRTAPRAQQNPHRSHCSSTGAGHTPPCPLACCAWMPKESTAPTTHSAVSAQTSLLRGRAVALNHALPMRSADFPASRACASAHPATALGQGV